MTKYLIAFLTTFLLIACNHQEPKFEFKDITFHSFGKGCEGFCPTYHLYVDSAKNISLYAETVWKNYTDINSIIDSTRADLRENESLSDSVSAQLTDKLHDKSKMGYFRGQVSDSNFVLLTQILSQINLDSLKFDNSNCCDGINKTLIINYNNKSKRLQAMFPPDNTSNLFRVLYNIINQDNLVKTADTLKIVE